MGLAQKRISNEFQTTEFSKWKKDFDAIVGFEMPMEVKWDSMLDDNRDNKELYFSSYNKVYFNTLTNIFKGLCSDAMGKEAVKGGVKKIVIDGQGPSGPKASTFDDGVFTIKHTPFGNVDDIQDRVKTWTKLLSLKL